MADGLKGVPSYSEQNNARLQLPFRLKAKRGAKRKAEQALGQPEEAERRPSKKRNIASTPTHREDDSRQRSSAKNATTVISSLFTANPEIPQPVRASVSKTPSQPSNAPLNDASTFFGLGLDPLLASHLTNKMHILKPTSIQRATLNAIIPELSTKTGPRDIFIQSQTGSGKTLAYLLPILQDLLPLGKLSYVDRSIGTLAIIIAPTRHRC